MPADNGTNVMNNNTKHSKSAFLFLVVFQLRINMKQVNGFRICSSTYVMESIKSRRQTILFHALTLGITGIYSFSIMKWQ